MYINSKHKKKKFLEQDEEEWSGAWTYRGWFIHQYYLLEPP